MNGAFRCFAPESLAELIEALPMGVFILDASGSAIYANAAATEILGKGIVDGDRAGDLAVRYSAYIAGTDIPYPTERMPIVRALAGERHFNDDTEIDRNGERIALEVTATPIFDENGQLVYAVAVFQDITARRSAQNELARLNEQLEVEVDRRTAELARTVEELTRAKAAAEQASRAKSMFLMNVSHELRTPLNHVIGFSELLAERVGDPKHRRLAETAHASGRDLLGRIDELIELARAESQPASASVTRFDFDALVRDVASSAGVPCHCNGIGTIVADEEIVRRVLSEVLQRAREDPHLSIRADRRDGSNRVVISICSVPLTMRLRALGHLFGEEVPPDQTRFLQQHIDVRLAIARAEMRRAGGDILAAKDQDAVLIVVPVA